MFQLYMKHKKNESLLHNLVPLFIQEELSLINNEPHVPLSELLLFPYDQSLQLLPEKVPSDLVPVQNPVPADEVLS